MPHSVRRGPIARYLIASIFIAVATPALASSGGGLPWEGPLQQIQESITGPVAGFIALAAVAVAGGMLIFGGEPTVQLPPKPPAHLERKAFSAIPRIMMDSRSSSTL